MFKLESYYEEQIVKIFGQPLLDNIRAELMEIWLILTDGKMTQNYKPRYTGQRFSISLCPTYCESLFHGRIATGFINIKVGIESTREWSHLTMDEFVISIYHQGEIELAKRRNSIRCLAGCDKMELFR